MVPEIIAEVQITYSSKVKASDRFHISGSSDAAKAFRSIWPAYDHIEFCYILMLNRRNQVLGSHQLSKGGMTGAIIDVRVLFQVALKAAVTSIIRLTTILPVTWMPVMPTRRSPGRSRKPEGFWRYP